MAKNIDRLLLQILRPEIDAALAALGEKHGLTIRAAGGSYGGTFGTFKLEIIPAAADGEIVGKEAEAFKVNADQFCMKPEDLGREFTAGGEKYRIVGAKPRASKMPILIKRLSDGSIRKCSPRFCLGIFDANSTSFYASLWK